MPVTSKRWPRRKIMIAVFASLGIFGLIATTFAAVLSPFLLGNSAQDSPAGRAAATPTSTIPPVIGRPLSIRPVIEALVTTPEQCEPAPPPPPTEPQFACDLDKKARYQLGPVGVQLNLTGVSAAKVPLTEFYGVQIGMDATSSAAFAQYTGANVGKQLAFVRDGVVLVAPKISTAVSGPSMQLSGEMTGPTADTIARMLREGT